MINENDIANQRKLFREAGFRPLLKGLGYRLEGPLELILAALSREEQWQAIQRADVVIEMAAFLVPETKIVVLAGLHLVEQVAAYAGSGLPGLCAELRGVLLSAGRTPNHRIPCASELEAIGKTVREGSGRSPQDADWRWLAFEAVRTIATAVHDMRLAPDGRTRALVGVAVDECVSSAAQRLALYARVPENEAKTRAHYEVSGILKEVLTIQVLTAPVEVGLVFRVEEMANKIQAGAN